MTTGSIRASARRPVARRAPGAPGAFTLMELLVVVGIIALLAAIVLGIGPKVIGGQQRASTQATLKALDGLLDEFVQSQGGALPAWNSEDYAGAPANDLKVAGDNLLKVVDVTGDAGWSRYPGTNDPEYPRFPEASVLLRAARGSREVADHILAELPTSQVRPTILADDSSSPADETDPSPSVLDAWGAKELWEAPFVLFVAKPVLFVHPKNLLAQALYGRCLNGKGYFVSPGADRVYGTTGEFSSDGRRDGAAESLKKALAGLKDNIYSYPPGPADVDPNSSFNRNIR